MPRKYIIKNLETGAYYSRHPKFPKGLFGKLAAQKYPRHLASRVAKHLTNITGEKHKPEAE